jgi:hypothetical protein
VRGLLTGIVALLFVSDAGVAQTRAPEPETYQSAAIDGAGNLVITRSDGQFVVLRKQGEQTSFSPPLVSSARTAVAAQAMFSNCCTSYDNPLELVVYANGRVHRFEGIGQPIFDWGFANGGTRIAFGQQPVHFGCSIHYELRDIASERLIDSADVRQPCGLDGPEPFKPDKVPQWITDLISSQN